MSVDWISTTIVILSLFLAFIIGGVSGYALYHFSLIREDRRKKNRDFSKILETAEADNHQAPLGWTNLERETKRVVENTSPYRIEMLNPFTISLVVIFLLFIRILFQLDTATFLSLLAILFFAVIGLTWYVNR